MALVAGPSSQPSYPGDSEETHDLRGPRTIAHPWRTPRTQQRPPARPAVATRPLPPPRVPEHAPVHAPVHAPGTTRPPDDDDQGATLPYVAPRRLTPVPTPVSPPSHGPSPMPTVLPPVLATPLLEMVATPENLLRLITDAAPVGGRVPTMHGTGYGTPALTLHDQAYAAGHVWGLHIGAGRGITAWQVWEGASAFATHRYRALNLRLAGIAEWEWVVTDRLSYFAGYYDGVREICGATAHGFGVPGVSGVSGVSDAD